MPRVLDLQRKRVLDLVEVLVIWLAHDDDVEGAVAAAVAALDRERVEVVARLGTQRVAGDLVEELGNLSRAELLRLAVAPAPGGEESARESHTAEKVCGTHGQHCRRDRVGVTAALGLDPHTSGIDLRDLGIGTHDAPQHAR